MPVLIDEKRQYQRLLPTANEQTKLNEAGFTPTFSSNVSGAKQVGADLYIRFWNGSIYKYSGQGKNFERLMAAASKGKWVWRFLRRKNVPYQKVGSLPLEQDIDVSDEEIIKRSIGIELTDTLVQQDYDTFNALTLGLINTSINTDILVSAIPVISLLK